MSQSKLTQTESQILEILIAKPMITQNELAEHFKVSRTSISVHINNLSKKGYILGRSYVLNPNIGVTAIGASMIDITGHSSDKLIANDSNPGQITISPGGVTRNISENLALLGVNVTLITALCDDSFGQLIKKRCADVGIDISHSYILPNGITTTYMAIIDSDGEMNIALSDTKALDQMPLKHLLNHRKVLDRNELIVIDAALPDQIIDYLITSNSDKRLFCDPVSIKKARSIKGKVGHFDTLKCNQLEAGYLANIDITDLNSLEMAANILLQTGLKRIIITRGKDGTFYQDAHEKGYVRSYVTKIENATGAGDAFAAGIVFGALNDYHIKDSVKFASAMSSLALQSTNAVNPLISIAKINEILRNGEQI